MTDADTDRTDMLIARTADIAAAHVGNTSVSLEDIPAVIEKVFDTLSKLGARAQSEVLPEPAVPVDSSVSRDHIVCLEDGRKLKTLKRHLMSEHGLTPEEYRKRWDLSSDYPMVAASYADRRSVLAKEIGLGRSSGNVAKGKPTKSGSSRKKLRSVARSSTAQSDTGNSNNAGAKAHKSKGAPSKKTPPRKAQSSKAPANKAAPPKPG